MPSIGQLCSLSYKDTNLQLSRTSVVFIIFEFLRQLHAIWQVAVLIAAVFCIDDIGNWIMMLSNVKQMDCYCDIMHGLLVCYDMNGYSIYFF